MSSARMCALAVLFAVAALVGSASAAGSDVIELDPTSFQAMLKSKDVWMVEFYGKAF